MTICIKNILLMSVFIFSVFVICSISIISTSDLQVIAQEASGGSSADRLLTFENFKYGFKISYPASWACKQQPLSVPIEPLIITLCPTRHNIDTNTVRSIIGDIIAQKNAENTLENALERTASLSIWVFPSFNQPLYSYVNDKIKELQGYGSNGGSSSVGAAPGFNLVLPPHYINIGNNIPAYEIEYTFLLDGTEKKVKAVWAINDSQAYEFLYLSDPPIYLTYLPVAQSIVNSFEFTS